MGVWKKFMKSLCLARMSSLWGRSKTSAGKCCGSPSESHTGAREQGLPRGSGGDAGFLFAEES